MKSIVTPAAPAVSVVASMLIMLASLLATLAWTERGVSRQPMFSILYFSTQDSVNPFFSPSAFPSPGAMGEWQQLQVSDDAGAAGHSPALRWPGQDWCSLYSLRQE